MATMKVKLQNTKVNMRRASAAGGQAGEGQSTGNPGTDGNGTETQETEGQGDDGQETVTVLALKNFQYGRRSYLALRRYEMDTQLARKLAAEGKVKITSA